MQMREQGTDLSRGRFEALQHGDQGASEDVIADHREGAQNESSPAQRRHYRRIMVVRPQPGTDGDLDVAGLGSKAPFLGAVEEGQDDAVVVFEVLRFRWFAAERPNSAGALTMRRPEGVACWAESVNSASSIAPRMRFA